MNRWTAAALLLLVAACKPDARGRCSQTSDCDIDGGVFCDEKTSICIAASGTCTPACAQGQLCSAGACTTLKPVVTVRLDPGALLSPAFAGVNVNVEASAELSLHGLSVEVVASSDKVASGSLAAAAAGQNTVPLSDIKAGVVGAVAVSAVLQYGDGESVRSVAVAANIDAAAPAVTLSIAPPGWVSRDGDPISVTAAADDGAGSGPLSATLSFDGCSGCAAVQGQLSGSSFTFQVPRSVQSSGSEAAVPFTVTVLDRAGNAGTAKGSLQIDDAAPRIDPFTLVTAPKATGEDDNPWFAGGASAPDVEIAVPVSDSGSGLGPVTLHINQDDVPGFSGSLDPAPTPPQNGAVHFNLPASAVVGREGTLRFIVTAKDVLGHTRTAPGAINVDDVPPQLVAAPQVDYGSAAPASACGPQDSATFACGRQAASHLLRDDTATVSFDAYDCGAGLPSASQLSVAVSGGSVTKQVPVSSNGKSGTPCAASANPTHHYSFTLNLSQLSSVDAPDSTGTALVHLVASAPDRVQNSATGSDGPVLVSLWRWKVQVANAHISGSPALLGGNAGQRAVVVGTDIATAATDNVFAVNPDGSALWRAQLGAAVTGDVAVGSDGSTVYAVTAGALDIVTQPGSHVQACAGPNGQTFGPPPAIVSAGGSDAAVIAAAGTSSLGDPNVLLFQQGASACQSPASKLLAATPTGTSAGGGLAFVSHNKAFSSLNASDLTSEKDFSTLSALVAQAAPAVAGTSPTSAVFGTQVADKSIRRAVPCVGSVCWTLFTGFTATQAGSSLLTTPVFDGTNIFAADDSGKVNGWSYATGAALPAPWPVTAGNTVSPPVMLGGGTLLVINQAGDVDLLSTAGVVTLGNVASFGPSGTAVAPVVDKRDVGPTPGGVAYIAAPAGWLYAWQVPAAPLAASSSVWPRPGRDSCNSRNASAACQ